MSDKTNPFNLLKRRLFTLLELLVALGLMLIILMSLGFFYYELEMINAEGDKLQKQSFRQRYLENRLANVLPHANAIDGYVQPGTKKTDSLFFTSKEAGPGIKPGSPNLIFTFDNGINYEKLLSNLVIGRLYLDEAGNLTLAVWPLPSRWPKVGLPQVKQEVLMEQVESIQFAFYVPPDPATEDQIRSKPIQGKAQYMEPEPKGSWITDWRTEYHRLPAMIRLIVTYREGDSEKTATYAFPFPNYKELIIYTD